MHTHAQTVIGWLVGGASTVDGRLMVAVAFLVGIDRDRAMNGGPHALLIHLPTHIPYQRMRTLGPEYDIC